MPDAPPDALPDPPPDAPLHDFDAYLRHLRARLGGPLPGPQAQLTMAPFYRKDTRLVNVNDKRCREAGVLALLFPLDGAPAVILTVRHDQLGQHPGQISFPGGRREPGETLRTTALRETHEEVGLAAAQIELAGALTPLYIPPSNFCVYPFVGVLPARPVLRPTDAEVARILYVPLSHLQAPTTRRVADWSLNGQTVPVPFFEVEGYRVWGATAMMLAELLAL